YGVYGVAPSASAGVAGYFDGSVIASGTLSAAAKYFRIDHPLDPANKYLVHSCVESDEMKNVYDGVVTLDPSGAAWLDLPSWFESLNGEFRYQLTCIGSFAPVYISHEIDNGRFAIAGGSPGTKVSWQVTGVRQDAFAKSKPMQVEVEKVGAERGRYQNPEAF